MNWNHWTAATFILHWRRPERNFAGVCLSLVQLCWIKDGVKKKNTPQANPPQKPLPHSQTLSDAGSHPPFAFFQMPLSFTSPFRLSRSHVSHSYRLHSPRLIFDCSVTTCLHLPETLGQGASETQLVKIHPAHSALAPESTCVSLMPAVSSHYLIGIEMHLACLFLSALHSRCRYPPHPHLQPPPARTLFHAILLGEAFFPLMCVQTVVYMALKKIREMAPSRSADRGKGNSCGSLQLIWALFNSWDLSCYSSFTFTVGGGK